MSHVTHMKRGFYSVMAAQFFSSLADNALLVACIAVLALMKSPRWMTPLLKLNAHIVDANFVTTVNAALCVIIASCIVAAIFNLNTPDAGVRYGKQAQKPLKPISDFVKCYTIPWKDKLGQLSLAVTTLFWGANAVLQFIVLNWAEKSLGMKLEIGINFINVFFGLLLSLSMYLIKRWHAGDQRQFNVEALIGEHRIVVS